MIARIAALVAVAVTFFSQSAFASTASSAEVRSLAQRARTDPAALDALERIDHVDGVPTSIGSTLRDATPAERDRRLVALSGAGAPSVSATAGARDRARVILADRRFRPAQLPKPFAGPLHRLGNVLRSAGRAVARFFDWFARRIPGPWWLPWAIGAGIVAAIAAVIAWFLGRRRRFVEVDRGGFVRLKSLRPDDLERAARDAEAAGKYADAIRLRFLAGLLRLDHAGAIKWHPSITAGAVKRKLRSKSFDRVASSFELVAYGERTPTEDDLELSKSGWREVLHSR